jgi:hypothetical protein
MIGVVNKRQGCGEMDFWNESMANDIAANSIQQILLISINFFHSRGRHLGFLGAAHASDGAGGQNALQMHCKQCISPHQAPSDAHVRQRYGNQDGGQQQKR